MPGNRPGGVVENGTFAGGIFKKRPRAPGQRAPTPLYFLDPGPHAKGPGPRAPSPEPRNQASGPGPGPRAPRRPGPGARARSPKPQVRATRSGPRALGPGPGPGPGARRVGARGLYLGPASGRGGGGEPWPAKGSSHRLAGLEASGTPVGCANTIR